MKRHIILGALLSLLLVISCSKGTGVNLSSNAAALTVVNLIGGSNGVYTNFTPGSSQKDGGDLLTWYISAARISYAASKEFSLGAGLQTLGIASATDTLTEEWVGNLELRSDSIYSIYFTGVDTLHIDTLMTIDSPPNFPLGDSMVGVRIVHSAQNTDPITVDVQGGDTLISNLAYKGYTGFFSFPATRSDPASRNYLFEFRDALSGNVIATYKYSSFHLFKSISLALAGNGATGSWRVVVVGDY